MENHERARLRQLSESDPRIRRLFLKHLQLEAKLEEVRKRFYKTSEDELEEKRLKLEKLRGKEEMLRIAEVAPPLA